MPGTTRVKASDAVRVDGLAELSRALKEMDKALPRQLREASKEVAQTVAGVARSRAIGLGGVAAKSAPSIKPSAGITSAGVTFGGDAYPFAAGAEFGSFKYPQFKPWRGNQSDAGYFVYPAIRDRSEQIQRTYEDKVNDLVKKVGLA